MELPDQALRSALEPAQPGQSFPLFLKLHGRPCLVVGGGAVAAAKAAALARCGASVRVLAPQLCPALRQQADAGEVEWHADSFRPDDLEGMALAVAATDRRGVNRAVATEARRRGIPVNVVDDPALSDWTSPAVVERGPLTIAVGSGGASPVLARLVKARIEALIPSAYGRLAALAGAFRAEAKRRLPHPTARRRFWEQVFEGPIGALMLSGREDEAGGELRRALEGDAAPDAARGEIYLVGAGPGHPELLTLRALRLMQQADVVLYDHLVSAEILALVRRDARRESVGKEAGRHSVPQGEINARLVALAQQGLRVLRLKGGDPLIFGRGAEEIETLAAHGVRFEIVPGVTAASGTAAFAGIPLTHRDYAQSCVLVTGHLKDGSLDLDWPALARPRQTVVIYMGLGALPALCARLVEHGLHPDTPAAVVEKATTAAQRVVVGTLGTLAGEARAAGLQPPALVVVGEVVRLRETLRWYDPAAAAPLSRFLTPAAAAPAAQPVTCAA
ncbi:MAG: siroheme synthase CysG [Pseudomonadota bacterium]